MLVTGCESITDASVTLSLEILSEYFSVECDDGCSVVVVVVVVVVLVVVDVLRNLLVVFDGIVDADILVVVGVVGVVVPLTDVLFVIFMDCQISSVVLFVSISLFTIPVLHSGTHITNRIVSCIQMSNGRPFLEYAMWFILMKNRAVGQSVNVNNKEMVSFLNENDCNSCKHTLQYFLIERVAVV